ncbi:rhamnosyltransferase WsaF family glycosyltransferase [Paenibacillus arenilitoris]|uniref:Glycosyltransferase n=1 Tax=Paenibacillus arenilitoris TaxID=2772299 RepID=A0A927CQ95_9BACL|nr:glycosyltransferase [Paenibacillus arenilitoris]MBD2871530.1 glycosyltransferase [Paenibacillus arenilitoris]
MAILQQKRRSAATNKGMTRFNKKSGVVRKTMRSRPATERLKRRLKKGKTPERKHLTRRMRARKRSVKRRIVGRQTLAPQVTTHHIDPMVSEGITFSTLLDFTSMDLHNSRVATSNVSGGPYETAIWFIPQIANVYYGGFHTIFRYAEYLHRTRGIRSNFAVTMSGNAEQYRSQIAQAFPLLSDCALIAVPDINNLSAIPPHDIGFCTLWITAYPLLKFNGVRKKIYFMQDYEPYFYPAGSVSSQAQATYRFGFTAICNTVSLKNSYEAHGGTAVHFTPALNTKVFHPHSRPKHKDKLRLFFYGRPNAYRNCFELGTAAIRLIKNVLGDRVEIISAGSTWDHSAYGIDGLVTHYGFMPYEQTGELYRSCDAGLVLMATRHPSYPPLELAACGALVITNVNEWNNWIWKDGVNCLLTEMSASSIAEKVIQGLTDIKLRHRITTQSIHDMTNNHSNWDSELKRVTEAVF